MAVRVGSEVPDIPVEYWVRGADDPKTMSLADYRGKWVVLFFYTLDFTFICPTEIAAYAAIKDDFRKAGAQLIAASTDSFYSHNTWFTQDKRLAKVDFPVIADTAHRLSKAFDLLLDNGSTLRGTFIIDAEGVVRHMAVNELDVGRNAGETLRVLRALKSGEMCPASWEPGHAAIPAYNEWLARAFPRLNEEVLADTTERLKTVHYEAGDIIIRQGDTSDRFYIVVDGEVAVIRLTDMGEEKEIARLGPGEVFGEMAILTEARRTADVRACTRVGLLALDWKDFKALVDSSDPTAEDFMRIVEQRRAQIPA